MSAVPPDWHIKSPFVVSISGFIYPDTSLRFIHTSKGLLFGWLLCSSSGCYSSCSFILFALSFQSIRASLRQLGIKNCYLIASLVAASCGRCLVACFRSRGSMRQPLARHRGFWIVQRILIVPFLVFTVPIHHVTVLYWRYIGFWFFLIVVLGWCSF